MATAKKNKELTTDQFLTAYMEYSLIEDQSVYNTFKFAKYLGVDEAAIYKHFSSLEQTERHVWKALLSSAIETVKDDKSYDAMSPYDQQLSLYFTVFENFTLNRSFLLQSMSRHEGIVAKKELWKDMHVAFEGYVTETFQSVWSEGLIKKESVIKLRRAGMQQGLWTQFALLIDYWRKDESKGFEKTDIAIEKSMKATKDLLDTTPIKSVVDLGKFLLQDKYSGIFKSKDEDSKEHTDK